MMSENNASDGVVVLKTKMTIIGNANPAIIELSDTYFVTRSVMINTPIQSRVGSGLIASTKPNNVATPFPPRKPT